MGFMGYGTKRLQEKADKRGISLDAYCNYLEMKKRQKGWAKQVKAMNDPKTD